MYEFCQLKGPYDVTRGLSNCCGENCVKCGWNNSVYEKRKGDELKHLRNGLWAYVTKARRKK